MSKLLTRITLLIVAVGVGIGAYWWWKSSQPDPLPAGIVASNGRIEAVQVDVATKFSGRIEQVLVKEGDLVQSGDVLVQMDTQQLRASLAQAEAQLAEVEQSVQQAQANIAKSESDVALAEKQAKRAEQLKASNAIADAEYDTTVNALAVARANLGSMQAALRTQEFAVKAAEAAVNQIETQLDDATLLAPARGRVLYRLAEKGEVLPAGGKVITLLDLSDIYMEVYVPAAAAAQLAIGAEARVVFDVARQFAAEAKVSFVAPEAQFTPKQVETADERDKLMFRVKVQLPPEKVEPYLERIKTGIRGVAYIKVDERAEWPAWLGPPFPDSPDDLEAADPNAAARRP